MKYDHKLTEYPVYGLPTAGLLEGPDAPAVEEPLTDETEECELLNGALVGELLGTLLGALLDGLSCIQELISTSVDLL